jgi:hypothetical protein
MVMVRAFHIAVIGWLSVGLMGCTPAEKQKPIWEKVKIGDIAPAQTDKLPVKPLKTINFDAHIFEIPAENVGKMKDIWQILYTKPLRFNNYNAFKANLFSVRFGQSEMWNKTLDSLRAAGGQKIVKVSLLLPDGQPSNLAVTGLNSQQTISYVSIDGSREAAAIGPGVLALRIKAQKPPASRGVCNLIAYPVFSPPIRPSVPQLAARAKLHELSFGSAGFELKMGQGDFVVLGPEKYVSDQTSLGGLFFSKPEGSMFFSETERKLPQRKPAVRIFLLVCTGINY